MKYNVLPGTGLKVSEICLGTMTFGDQLPEQGAIEASAYAFDSGINFFDTADIYFRGGAGESERITGKAIKPFRKDIVLATKCCGPMSMNPNDRGLSRKHVFDAVEASLKRLDTDYIDILYYHFPDPDTPVEDFVMTANMLIQQGKIRYYGLSNFSAWQTCEAYLTAKHMNLAAPVVTESVYNLVTRGVEDEMLPMLQSHPMGLVCYNPLAGGLLTGKHSKGAAAPDSRFTREKGYANRYFLDNNLDAVEELKAIAADCGISLIELALKWLLAQKQVTSVITGFSKVEHLKQNIEMAERPMEVSLPADRIDEVWKVLKGNRYSYHY